MSKRCVEERRNKGGRERERVREGDRGRERERERESEREREKNRSKWIESAPDGRAPGIGGLAPKRLCEYVNLCVYNCKWKASCSSV